MNYKLGFFRICIAISVLLGGLTVPGLVSGGGEQFAYVLLSLIAFIWIVYFTTIWITKGFKGD